MRQRAFVIILNTSVSLYLGRGKIIFMSVMKNIIVKRSLRKDLSALQMPPYRNYDKKVWA